MNKLAILAFSLLMFFSTMLWYLANGSLNEYLKSQVTLQGHYYSGQITTVEKADFSSNTGTAIFTNIRLKNPDVFQNNYALTIDEASIELAPLNTAELSQNSSAFEKKQDTITTVEKLTINTLVLNSEQSNNKNNIQLLTAQVNSQLAHDYPELYPAISAKLYAEQNPTLNADSYAKNHPQAGPIVAHTTPKKKRGKAQQKIAILAINIKTLILNTTQDGVTNSITKYDVNLSAIGKKEGLVANQLGGELLVNLLNLAKQ